MDIFNKIAKDPQGFVIDAPNKDITSSAAKKQLRDKLSAFAEHIESFQEQYVRDLTNKYYEDPDLDSAQDEWDDDYPLTDHDANELELSAFRTQFMEILQEAAILLNLDEGDITSTYGFEFDDVEEGFFVMQDDETFTDENALQVLEGIQKEIEASIAELNNEDVKTAPPISKFLAENDDGTMYDDPSGP